MCNRYRLTHAQRYLAERFQAWDDFDGADALQR